MPPVTTRIPNPVLHPKRTVRPASSKIIFLSMEGAVTEEMYFKRVTELFPEVASRIQFISVAEDAVGTPKKFRTPSQIDLLTKNRPKQLVSRIEQFKIAKDELYQFSAHPDDEFWIVTDVDKNWSNDPVSKTQTYIEEWRDAITMCQTNGYDYAVSNPFFEIWLLLHHDSPTDEDKSKAVTPTNSYSSTATTYFNERLRSLKVPLRKTKHITPAHYTRENMETAVARASALHIDKNDLCPTYFATTVYRLLQKIMELVPQDSTSLNQKV